MSHKLASKPVIMANGKEASGLVPRVARESSALSQRALGPGRSSGESLVTTVPLCHGAAQLSEPTPLWACSHTTLVGLIQVYFSCAMQ